MYISKHHYAVVLAQLGNKVYFLNSPDKSGNLKSGEVRIEPSGIDNLQVIKHKFFYPYLLKHKLPSLHRMLLRYHIRRIYRVIGRPVDIVWSFDVSDTIHLASFPGSSFKIFMPVDNPVNPLQEKRADVMFSVTREILDNYKCSTPKMFVNHGVAEHFINDDVEVNVKEPIQVGISGNFLRPDIDWHCLLEIIKTKPDIVFNFWGSFNLRDSNLAANHDAAATIIKQQLKGMDNVVIHGAVDGYTLAEGLKKMDCFLICYDIEKDQSKGTNYHKVLEYLAAGKVIVSNNITTYAGTGLVEMPEERNNKNLSRLFEHVTSNLALYNSSEKQHERIAYAKKHTYLNNVRTIEQFILSQNKPSVRA